MHGIELLHSLFSKTLGFMHAKRLSALLDAVLALLIGKKLSLTHLGRHLQNNTKERHCIRKLDRLLGNKYLHKEIKYCYQVLSMIVVNKMTQPIISIDWAATNKKKDWHILRASLNIQGRGLVLYQEVHPYKKLNSRQVQNRFLDTLKAILPPDCKPIIVTDAGFRFPWFKKVRSTGFHFVGRVRNKTGYQKYSNHIWHENCLTLYEKATNVARHLGRYLFLKKIGFECEVILYKKRPKHRKHMNRSGKATNNTASNRCSRRNRDPWLLVTSLDVKAIGAQKIVALYSKRMQIEEDFRDLKSHQFGFSLRYSMSNSSKRIEVLLLIAALASLVCWLLSLSAKKNNLHLDFQSNTITSRNVLSVIYLGCQLIRRKVTLVFEELISAYFILQKNILGISLC